jgi:catechol 2,3-dioxygenase-like lactoylglutathione lyase family enzyme
MTAMTGVPRLAGVHHLKLPVRDLDRSREWYRSRLGYQVAVEFVEQGRVMGLAMRHPGGGPDLALRLDPERAAAAAGFDYFSIGVPDQAALNELAERLTAFGESHAGVQFDVLGWILPLLHDPDGHEVRFYTAEHHTQPPEQGVLTAHDLRETADRREQEYVASVGGRPAGAGPMPEPTAELDRRFSSPDATPRPWSEVVDVLEHAEIFWLSTVRRDGRPHVTPLPAVWLDGSLHFCTGPGEQKARNLAASPQCVLTTGTDRYRSGLDVVVEGAAVRVTDVVLLERLAARWQSKLGWSFEVADGAFRQHGGVRADPDTGIVAYVFSVTPSKVLAFGKGEPFSQTRYRFPPET